MVCKTKIACVIMTCRDGSIRAYRLSRTRFFTRQNDFAIFIFPIPLPPPLPPAWTCLRPGLAYGLDLPMAWTCLRLGPRARPMGLGPWARAQGPGPGPLRAGGGRRAVGHANSDPTGVYPPTQDCYPPAGGEKWGVSKWGFKGRPRGPKGPPWGPLGLLLGGAPEGSLHWSPPAGG